MGKKERHKPSLLLQPTNETCDIIARCRPTASVALPTQRVCFVTTHMHIAPLGARSESLRKRKTSATHHAVGANTAPEMLCATRCLQCISHRKMAQAPRVAVRNTVGMPFGAAKRPCICLPHRVDAVRGAKQCWRLRHGVYPLKQWQCYHEHLIAHLRVSLREGNVRGDGHFANTTRVFRHDTPGLHTFRNAYCNLGARSESMENGRHQLSK